MSNGFRGSNVARRAFLKGAGTVLIAGQNLWGRLAWGGDAAQESRSLTVDFDDRSLIFGGKRELLVSGEMHYARSTRAMWPYLLDRGKELGLNCIATYVFWNFHEPQRDVYDFSGDRDLGHFLNLCKERQLKVFLRSGPYCCAEWNYGGYPPYLRDEPGITIRTMSAPYLRRVEKYFERLAIEVNPHLAARGGPISLIQVENEYANVAKRYGAQGQEYLRWMAGLARRVGFADVPTTMCEGAIAGPIATLNGFEIPASRIADFRSRDNHDPLLWTELYPAWYDTWGETREPEVADYTQDWNTHRSRDPRTIALAILAFIGNGGSGWNYYMWHGGTNFGRSSMYLQTTSYDFKAPIDEYGRPSFKGVYLGRLHKTLRTYEDYLLQGQRSSAMSSPSERRIAWTLQGRELILILNYPSGALNDPDSHPLSAKLFDPDGKIVFDTQNCYRELESSWSAPVWNRVETAPFSWRAWTEPMPIGRPHEKVRSLQPVEQLLLTKDQTDYCWYSTQIDVKTAGPQELVIPYGGDFFYVYLDGQLSAQTAAPLKEDRGLIVPEDPVHRTDGYRHTFKLSDVMAGNHRLDILATALGMIKGDWQIAAPMNFERKGIWEGVLFNGQPLSSWEMIPFLAGEKSKIVEASASIQWRNFDLPQPLCWYMAKFQLSAKTLAEDADYRLDAAGLGKGMLFLNGKAAGRHWLIVSPGTNGQPTQQYYHLPRDWFGAENTLIVFEEQAVSPSDVQLKRRQAGRIHA